VLPNFGPYELPEKTLTTPSLPHLLIHIAKTFGEVWKLKTMDGDDQKLRI